MDSLKLVLAGCIVSIASASSFAQTNPFFEIIGGTSATTPSLSANPSGKVQDLAPSPYEPRFQAMSEPGQPWSQGLGPAIDTNLPSTWPASSSATCPPWRTTPLLEWMQQDPCSLPLWGNYQNERECRHARRHRFVHGTNLQGNNMFGSDVAANSNCHCGGHGVTAAGTQSAHPGSMQLPLMAPPYQPPAVQPTFTPQAQPAPHHWASFPQNSSPRPPYPMIPTVQRFPTLQSPMYR